MLPPTVIREIELLLEQGRLSRRQIAKRLGVARGTVTAVLMGQRRADHYLKQVVVHKPLGEARRCPSCKAIVQMPCKLCRTRELMAGRQLPSPEPVVEAPIGLNLRPEHKARYAQVRRWRREALRLGIVPTPETEFEIPSTLPCDPGGLPCPQKTDSNSFPTPTPGR